MTTYRDAGVDIAAADAFLERVGADIRSTHTDAVLPGPGAYAGLFKLPNSGQVLAAACDGVGTKLLLARDLGLYEGLGQDLVAMNVNDLLPVGARPLLFLDYIATGKLDPEPLAAVVRGMVRACHLTGCVLLGGETAEMPGAYRPGEFDLAGFTVGLVEHKLHGDMTPGDVVLGLPSTGFHSNGYSLVRKVIADSGLALTSALEGGETLGEALLRPTALYVTDALTLMRALPVKACAHVTGGGLLGRAEKLVGKSARVVLHTNSWRLPLVMQAVRQAGRLDPAAMARTFNLGLGFLAVLAPDVADEALRRFGDRWAQVGNVVAGAGGAELNGDFATA